MELRLFSVTALLIGGLLWAAASSCALAGPQGRDYLAPSESRGGYTETASRLQSGTAASKPAARLSYRAFDGQSYDLREYRGYHVRVLLPDAPAQGPFFTAEHVEELVYRLDALYALYRDILGMEPDGSGLLTVAFVPETCGTGCGLLGARGIEIKSLPLNYELIIEELDAGRLESLLVHEMVHNFDRYAAHLHYLPDHPHAWTDFFQYFAAHRYGRQTLANEAADDLYHSPVSAAWKTWVANPGADWATCVRDGGCEHLGLNANNAWAMPYYRMESLYGIEAILRSFEFLTEYVTRQPKPSGAEAREALRMLSLAHGAGVNLACQLEPLRWSLPQSLRDDLQRLFGAADPRCADADADGYVAVTGDCDEADPTRHVLGVEIEGNRRDDDCDGMVDEKSLSETAYGGGSDPFGTRVSVTLPFEAEGAAAGLNDVDAFSFRAGPTGRVRVTLCADDAFRGWAAAQDAAGRYLDSSNYFTYRDGAGCSQATFDYGPGAAGRVAVIPDDRAGDYSIIVAEASALPGEHAALLAAKPRPAGGVELRVEDLAGQLAALGADQLELWIAGTGVRQTVPYSHEAGLALTRSAFPVLSDGTLYQARLRPLQHGHPLLPFSAGHLFRFKGGPAAATGIDHRHSGAWFDPTHAGEGFIVEVLDEARALVYWFTYTRDGRQRWMLGVGAVEGSRIVVDELLDSRGGRFGAAFDPARVELQPAGSLSIAFEGCHAAVANYQVDNIGGSQALTRLTELDGHACDTGAPAGGGDLSGSWYDPSHDGEGFVVQQLEGGRAAVWWFSYDADGEQAWFHNTGTVDGNRIVFDELLQPEGGLFGRSFDPDTVQLAPWGSLELQLDCGGGTARYQPTADGFEAGTQSLVSLTRIAGSTCGL